MHFFFHRNYSMWLCQWIEWVAVCTCVFQRKFVVVYIILFVHSSFTFRNNEVSVWNFCMMIPDLNTSCRLCFKNTGENDVTTAPSLYATIKDYYNVEVRARKLCLLVQSSNMTFLFFHSVAGRRFSWVCKKKYAKRLRCEILIWSNRLPCCWCWMNHCICWCCFPCVTFQM